MVMDHGRTGPQGVLGGEAGGVNTVVVTQGGKTYRPPHLSKDQDIEIGVGDVVRVQTPGGGGFGDPAKRKPESIARDVARGYYTRGPGPREVRPRRPHESSSRRCAFLAAASIAADAVAWPAPRRRRSSRFPTKWYAVQVEENAFTVEMPGIPDHRVISDVSARGTPFALHSYSLESGGNSYVAQTALYPADVDVTQPRRVLQAALDGRAQQLAGGKWDRIDWREIGGGGRGRIDRTFAQRQRCCASSRS